MQRMRKFAAIPLAVAATALALTACAPAGGSGQSTGEESTLTLGMTADMPGLSPLLQPSYQGWFADAAWDALLICDEFGKPSAQLATEWEYNEDQTAATLTLREGVKFSDGSDFDAEDVVATLTAVGEVNDRFADLEVRRRRPVQHDDHVPAADPDAGPHHVRGEHRLLRRDRGRQAGQRSRGFRTVHL